LGGGFVVSAVVLVVVFSVFVRPIPLSEMTTAEMTQRAAGNLTPAQTLELWEAFKQGLDQRRSPIYERQLGIYHLAQGFCVVLGLGGAAMVAAGVAGRRRVGEGERGRGGETLR
jgi:hypothetical protein